MKKFYILLLALVCTLTAQALGVQTGFSCTVKVIGYEHCRVSATATCLENPFSIQYLSSDTFTIKAKTAGYPVISVSSDENYMVTRVYYEFDGNETDWYTEPNRNRSLMLDHAKHDGTTLYIIVKNEAEMFDGTFDLEVVGKPSRFSIATNKQRQITGIKEGTQTVDFILGSETTLWINPTSGTLYRVSVDGNICPGFFTGENSDGYQYNVPLQDNCHILIEVDYPDEQHMVSITSNIPDFITSVKAGGTAVTDWSQPFAVQCGSQLVVSCNTDLYRVDSFLYNGEDANFNTPWSVIVTEDLSFDFNVTKYATFPYSIDVDDASMVRVYMGDAWKGNVVALQNGHNELEALENYDGYLYITSYDEKIEDPDYIASVTVNGKAVKKDNYQGFQTYFSKGDAIVINTNSVGGGYVNIYVNQGWMQLQDANEAAVTDLNTNTTVALDEGYNCVAFTGETMDFSIWAQAPAWFFINNEAAPSDDIDIYDGSYSWYAQGYGEDDMLKIYVSDEEPQPCTVNISFFGFTRLPLIFADGIRTLTNNTTNELPGTQITVAQGLEDIDSVLVNNKALEGDSRYTFNVEGPTELVVKSVSYSGIDLPSADIATDLDIYNLQGIKVSTKGTANLPAGLYIQGGHKVLVK